MGSLRIAKPGLLTLLQDQGRAGLAFFAIPRSGPMDSRAFGLANTLLGNEPTAPAIECHFVPPTLYFETSADLCLTGADMQWSIDGQPVERQCTLEVSAGSTLAGKPACDGCRAYIGIRGSIKTELTYGSAACYVLGGFGGNQGKALAAGDIIQWREPTEPLFPLQLALETEQSQKISLQLLPGPEFDWLNKDSLTMLETESFSISSDSNRMGARLHGPKLQITAGRILTESVPLLPGMIQLTPSGQCVVVLQDGQTTGGYPRIGFLSDKTRDRLSQIPLNQSFQFRTKAT